MNIKIRQERQDDHPFVFNLIKDAFEDEEYSDHQEHFLVERLRESAAFVPELSLVAEMNGQIVGFIVLTKILVKNETKTFGSLAMAPVAVLPKYQGKGVGGMLIRAAHEKAKELGYGSIILLGHDKYYPRFGYEQLNKFGIRLPFDVPEPNCMAIELVPNALKNVSGVVEYPKAFFE